MKIPNQILHSCIPACCVPSIECIRVEAQMNSIFSWIDKLFLEARPLTARAIVFMGLVIFGACSFVTLVRAQSPGDPFAEFKRISEELSAARLSGGTENQALMEKAL